MHTATMGSASVLPPPRHQPQHSASSGPTMSTSQYGPQQMGPMLVGSNGHHQNGPTGISMHISPFYGPNFPQANPASQMVQQQQQQQLASSTTQTSSFDPRNLEIKTRSVEQTLLPLVQQISTLVNFKESIITGGRPKSERALRAALKIGTAVEAAVERFVAVGETIADENPDIQPELYDACHEARVAGSSIANLHNSMLAESHEAMGQGGGHENGGGAGAAASVDTAQLVRASRQLLSSVTRVLLLADRVLVKHILRAEDKIAYSLTKLEHTSNFSEFVQIFTEFGGQMVDLAHRSGDRQQDLKSEKRQAQMQVSRAQLERLTMLLLTSSKTLLRHPDDPAARQCRDGVFHQIRTALQLISICVTDGVMHFEAGAAYPSPMDELSRARDGPLDIGIQLTASVAIRQLAEMLDMCRMMSMIGAGVRERLVSALGALCEMSGDFTESAWTAHQQREQILDLLEECRFEMGNLVNPPANEMGGSDERLRSESVEVTVERLNRRLKDLRKQLQVVALEQIAHVFRQNDDQTILSSLKTCAISGDIDGVERFLEQFRLHAEHLQEVCRLLHHISLTDALHVYTGHAERNLRALAPLSLLAGRVLCVHPSSRIARENLEVFCDTWATNVNDLARLTKELDAACSGRLAAEKQAYMSLPRPGVSPFGQTSPLLTSSSTPSSCSAFGGQVCRDQFGGGAFVVVGCAAYGHAAAGLVQAGVDPRRQPPFAPSSNQRQCFGQMPSQMMAQSTTFLGITTSPFLPGQSPAPLPRLARAASTPAAPVPPSPAPIGQLNGERRAKTPGADGPKKQQILEVEGKEKRKGRKKPGKKGAEEQKEEEENEKKAGSRMSFSAIFRRIRRESSRGRKKRGRKEEAGHLECHSEGEAEEKEGQKQGRKEEEPSKFSQSSRSLRVELAGDEGKEGEEGERKNEKVGHSPLYARIKKMPAQTKEEKLQDEQQLQHGHAEQREGVVLEEGQRPPPKSAFTPYGQFNGSQKQKQQKEQAFACTSPPRPRRKEKEEEQVLVPQLRGGGGHGGEMKFNRVEGGEQEPIIIRQLRADSYPSSASIQESTNSSGYGTAPPQQNLLERQRSTSTSGAGSNSRKSSGQEGQGEELVVPFEAREAHQKEEKALEEEEEEGEYATVLMGMGRAPLARCEEAEEEDEGGEESGQEAEDSVKGKEQGKEEFVVRMRAKKSARQVAGRQMASAGSKFEQRISQILESLQAEAESLIRLQHQQQHGEVGAGSYFQGYWTSPRPSAGGSQHQ